jgi:hypothetical protein
VTTAKKAKKVLNCMVKSKEKAGKITIMLERYVKGDVQPYLLDWGVNE